MGHLNVEETLAEDWPAPCYRAALMVLATLSKDIPALPVPPDEFDQRPTDVDWDTLEEWAGPWSRTEKVRVRLARSLYEGDLCDASLSFDNRNWERLVAALEVARCGEEGVVLLAASEDWR
jgi:hypothetical protein